MKRQLNPCLCYTKEDKCIFCMIREVVKKELGVIALKLLEGHWGQSEESEANHDT